jgi:NADH-quinone oxidoreductase subunit J
MSVALLNAILFYALAAGAVGLAVAVVQTRHILRAALALMGVLGFTAGLYVVLSATLLAAVEVLVYIGGIVVLFVLAVMLSSPTELLDDVAPLRRRLLGFGAAALYFLLSLAMCIESPFESRQEGALPNAADLAQSFLGRGASGYLIPFELISLLLLGAAVGAIVLARKVPAPGGGAQPAGKEAQP